MNKLFFLLVLTILVFGCTSSNETPSGEALKAVKPNALTEATNKSAAPIADSEPNAASNQITETSVPSPVSVQEANEIPAIKMNKVKIEAINPKAQKTYAQAIKENNDIIGLTPTQVTINYHFSSGDESISSPNVDNEYRTEIGKSELNDSFVLLDSETASAELESKTYLIYEKKFDLLIRLYKMTPILGENNPKINVTFIIKTINLLEVQQSNEPFIIDVYLNEGQLIQNNLEEISSELIGEEITSGMYDWAVGSQSGGRTGVRIGLGGQFDPEKNKLRINFHSGHLDYYSTINYIQSSQDNEKNLVLPIIFNAPFNNLTRNYSTQNFHEKQLIINDGVSLGDTSTIIYPVDPKLLALNPLEHSNPQTIKYYVLDSFPVQTIYTSKYKWLFGNIAMAKTNVAPADAETINLYKKPFTLKLGDCQEFKTTYSDFKLDDCPNQSIAGIILDSENQAYDLWAQKGQVIVRLPNGTEIESSKKGSSFSLACNKPRATINLTSCQIGTYNLTWYVPEVFNGVTPATTAELYFNGTSFTILSQENTNIGNPVGGT